MAHRNFNSLRSQIRVALLAVFATGSYGTVEEVEKRIRSTAGPRGEKRDRFKAGSPHLAVQISQVRNDLLEELGVERPTSGKGRMSKEAIAEIERKLRLKRTTARLEKLQKVDETQLAEAA